ncbi:MAG: TAXI family TRAP transporter solute-binding subunit [Rhizobiaceae bacterium]
MRIKLIAALAAMVVLAPLSGHAQDALKLTLTGGSPAGLWSMLGAAVDSAVRTEVPDSVITYQTSGGGLANVAIVSNGQAELGIMHNIELKAAVEGEAPFREPVKNLRALAVLYDWAPMQLVITRSFAERYGIKTVGDIIDKKAPVRFAVNQRGNMVEAVNRAIFEAYGATWEDIEAWGGQIIYAPGGEMNNLFNDRRIDMGGNGVFVPDRRFVEASRNQDMMLLPLDEKVIQEVAAKTGADPYVIAAGGYDWQDKSIPTVALSAALVASADMSEETAYQITKALVNEIDQVRGVHKAMSNLTPKLMPSLSLIPYHPGALRAYREAGLAE